MSCGDDILNWALFWFYSESLHMKHRHCSELVAKVHILILFHVAHKTCFFFQALRVRDWNFILTGCVSLCPLDTEKLAPINYVQWIKELQSFILYEWFASVMFLDSPASIIHRTELNNVSFAVETAKLLDTNLSMAFDWHTNLFSNEPIFFSPLFGKQTLFVLACWV